LAPARQHDDRHALVLLPHPPQQLEAVDVRQAEIEDDQVRLLPDQLERDLAARGIEDVVALGGEDEAQELADARLVVAHQHLERGCAAAAVSSLGAAAGLGNRAVNTAPLRSARLAAAMVPCSASTKPREIASPRPVPARTWSPFCTR